MAALGDVRVAPRLEAGRESRLVGLFFFRCVRSGRAAAPLGMDAQPEAGKVPTAPRVATTFEYKRIGRGWNGCLACS